MRDGNRKAVEMTGRGKRGKPKTGFPLFPPPLEIASDFHIPTASLLLLLFFPNQFRPHRILERILYLTPSCSRLIFRLEYAGESCPIQDEPGEKGDSNTR
jgi:hypothetical protein